MKKFSDVIETIRKVNEQELSDLQKSYREYFTDKLKKFDAESPADLNDEQKKEFFNEIKKDWEKGKDVKESEDVNESLLLAGGLVVLTALGIRGIRNIVENMRIEKNLNKEIAPAKLKETMQKIWDETSTCINASEQVKAKAWLDDCLAKVDNGEFKTLKDFQTSLNAQVFEGEYTDSFEEIAEGDIKSKEDFAKFAKDKLKKVHGDDFDEEKAQEVIDGLSKDAEKDDNWGAAVGKLNKA